MSPVARIIGLWPSAEHYAADIGLKYPSYARVMKMRGRIPEKYWGVSVEAALHRGIKLSAQDLKDAHPARSRKSSQGTEIAA